MLSNPKLIRRVLLIEVDVPTLNPTGRAWSPVDLEARILIAMPELNARVWGELSPDEVDATFRKVRQLAIETENERPLADRVHSAHKAQSFFRDMLPLKFWNEKKIGAKR